MFLGPLLHEMSSFRLPYAGGCDLGTRTVEPHLTALRYFGLDVHATHGFYEAEVDGETQLTATLSGPSRSASRRRLAAVISSASSQPIRCQPGSGSPFGRVRLRGYRSRSGW